MTNHTHVGDLELLLREQPNTIYTKAELAEKYGRAPNTIRQWGKKIQNNDEIKDIILIPLAFLCETVIEVDGEQKTVRRMSGGYVNYDPSCCEDEELEAAITATIENTLAILKGYRRIINRVYKREDVVKLIPHETKKYIEAMLPGRAAGQ